MNRIQIISIIVATDQQGLIGLNNQIPWKSKVDMKRFKEKTTDGTLIMGRVTYESLPSKTLSNRNIIVLSSKVKDVVFDGQVYWAPNLKLAINQGQKLQKHIWIAGGVNVYWETIRENLWNDAEVTVINKIISVKDGQKADYFNHFLLKESQESITVEDCIFKKYENRNKN